MSATPIPRTLMMTAYGDLDVSRLVEKPPGRQPVDTRTVPLDRAEEVTGAIARALARGAKVFWVCPMVEESETADIAAAEERHRALSELLPGRVGLVHGRMKGADKDRAMAAFAEGPADLLVATTVIEVGIDVPAATVMVVEHAERFGLAQLHQLRGRIGRGAKPRPASCSISRRSARSRGSACQSCATPRMGSASPKRICGCAAAARCSARGRAGCRSLRLADLARHEELIAVAHDDARLVLDRDPELASPRGAALRPLLYLFRRDEAVQYLRAG